MTPDERAVRDELIDVEIALDAVELYPPTMPDLRHHRFTVAVLKANRARLRRAVEIIRTLS